MSVSAVIPMYNRRDHIFRAVDSVLSQTKPVDEVIIVDDGSTDGSYGMVQRRYRNKVRIIRQKNLGVSGARLRGIQEATGEWIAFLDSDDEWMSDRQREFTSAIATLPPDVAWIFGDMHAVNDQGETRSFFEAGGLKIAETPQIIEDPMSVLFPVQYPWLQGSIIRRDVLVAKGCFGAGLRTHEDRLAALQVACEYRFAAISSVVTRVYRTSDLVLSSLTQNGVNTPDHYRALLLMIPLLIEKTRKRGEWAQLYAGAVRGLCKLRAGNHESVFRLTFEQFRYGFSITSTLFLLAVMLGRPGLSIWNLASAALRVRSRNKIVTTNSSGVTVGIADASDHRIE